MSLTTHNRYIQIAFNGADIAILNVVGANDPNAGLHENENFRNLYQLF